MPASRRTVGLLSTLLLLATTDPGRAVEPAKLSRFASGLDRLVAIWQDVRHLHDYLHDLHPVALVVGDSLVIFEPASDAVSYVHDSTVAAPFPMSSAMRAAFPLQATGGRAACVVGEDVLQSEDELVLLLHEFVHCSQYGTVEQELKTTLGIAAEAAERGDFMWELEHPFPYADPMFESRYEAIVKSFLADDAERALSERARLSADLSPIDREYMVWQEWKEGLARFLENRIREERGLPVNAFGGEPPYDRIAFYRGGDLYIAHLVHENPELHADPKALFEAMQ